MLFGSHPSLVITIDIFDNFFVSICIKNQLLVNMIICPSDKPFVHVNLFFFRLFLFLFLFLSFTVSFTILTFFSGFLWIHFTERIRHIFIIIDLKCLFLDLFLSFSSLFPSFLSSPSLWSFDLVIYFLHFGFGRALVGKLILEWFHGFIFNLLFTGLGFGPFLAFFGTFLSGLSVHFGEFLLSFLTLFLFDFLELLVDFLVFFPCHL